MTLSLKCKARSLGSRQSPPSTTVEFDGGRVTREDCPHLSAIEWDALERMAEVVGESVIASMLRTLSPEEHRAAALRFVPQERGQQQPSVAAKSPRVEFLKLNVSPYRGGEGEPLLRWLVELDAAVNARQVTDEGLEVSFAMSCLAGWAKTWAYGRRLHDPSAFTSYEEFKSELKLTFEPPKNEFRSRAEFLDLRQGKHDIHAYSQRARYLVSNAVEEPIDMATQIAVYTKGLSDGPIKTYLFRDHPKTLEEAISRSIQEDFSGKQSKLHSHAQAPRLNGPEPMDLSAVDSLTTQTPGKKSLRYNRCGKNGHFTYECMVLCPAPRSQRTEPTRSVSPQVSVGHVRVTAPDETLPRCEKQGDEKALIILRLRALKKIVRALFDTGASNNFVRAQSLFVVPHVEVGAPHKRLIVRLATGSTVEVAKRVIRARFKHEEKQFENDEIVLELDKKFDVTLGMPRMTKSEPMIDSKSQSIAWSAPTTIVRSATESDGPVCVPSASLIALAQSRDVSGCDGPDPLAYDCVSVLQHKRHAGRTSSAARKAHSRVAREKPVAGRKDCRDLKKKSATSGKCARGTVEEQRVDDDDHHERSEKNNMDDEDRHGERGHSASGKDRGTQEEHAQLREVAECKMKNRSSRGRCRIPPHLRRADRADEDIETINVLAQTETGVANQSLAVRVPPRSAAETTRLPSLSWKKFLRNLRDDKIEQICIVMSVEDLVDIRERMSAQAQVAKQLFCSSSAEDAGVTSDHTKVERFIAQSWETLKKSSSFYDVLREYADVFPDEVPCELPHDKGTRHEIDLAPGTKYCVTRQWPLPRDQVNAIDEFFDARLKAGHVRESTSPHTSSTFCVKKATGGWRIVHAFNKLNAATIPAQTPIPRKDVVIDGMSGSTIFSALDLRDGLYQILMREKDIPLTAVSTPSGMLWEWLVMPQGLENVPATFNRCVTHLLRSVRDFAPSYFGDVSRRLPIGRGQGTRRISASSLVSRPFSLLLKKDAPWDVQSQGEDAFSTVKGSLTAAPILAIADHGRPFHVVCDASDCAIGCTLMQTDREGHKHVVCFQSRQLKPAERNYPVHDKELLAMKYALAKFRIYLLGDRPFVIYTDHASLRTAVNSPHLSQRMARWLPFFTEYHFRVEYKPGRFNVIADALSRRPDFDPMEVIGQASANVVRSTTLISSLVARITSACEHDEDTRALISFLSDKSSVKRKLPSHLRARVHRYRLYEGVLLYSTNDNDAQRVVVPNDEDLKMQILFECRDKPFAGRLGRKETYVSLARDFYWPKQYKWVRKYVRACEVCQRSKPAHSSQAPLHSLPVPSECWKSVLMDFVFGLPPDNGRRTGVLVFVDRFSKMVHLTAVSEDITAAQTARVFVDTVFRLHGMPQEIVSDRDPRFTARFWMETFALLGTKLSMSTSDHPETDGQTERVNRAVGGIVRSYAHAFLNWSDCLPFAEFAINNSIHREAVHAKPKETHVASATSDMDEAVNKFVLQRQAVIRYVRDSIADAFDERKRKADAKGRKNFSEFRFLTTAQPNWRRSSLDRSQSNGSMGMHTRSTLRAR
ncbi:reverse transcriptase, partial [Globisporangium splendens]